MIATIDTYALVINFFAHMLIFVGSFYVVMHNRRLPKWHVTPLWYVGLSALACNIAIALQWGLGTEFPLSYANIGLITETCLNISLATLAAIFFSVTVLVDMKESKRRQG